jgi:predicted Zn-dependent peptidase
MHEVPVVEVLLVVRAGATADPARRDGLARMTADMLDEGAGGKDALALADAVDFLGAQLDTEASWDASTVRLRVPVARLDEALPLMADVALRPDFPEAELVRLRKEALTALLQARDVPGRIAARALSQAVFGAGHRYGRPEGGDAAQIASFTVAELREFHGARYVPSAATLVVVGDVTREVLPKLEKSFGAWPANGSPAAPAVPAPAPLKGRTVWLVDKPGAAQSAIRIGAVGPSWSAPGYPAAEVTNTLLGGSFTSRLNDNIREQHGYAYGAGSRVQRFRTGGMVFAASDVQTDKTGPAVSEFVKELTRIRTPATGEEVERARSYAALGYAGDFETTAQVARRMADRVVYDLPESFFEEFVPKALAVDVAALQASARELFDPSRMAYVVVGDRKAVEGQLRGLGLGTMRTLTVEDVMGPAPKVE